LDNTALAEAGIDKVEVSGPYLNFFVSRLTMASRTIPGILEGTFFAPRPAKADKIMIEYSQPNTHKAFHVGHLRNATLGDSIGRLLQWLGHEVVQVNYIGDEGAHVAKCLWYLRYVHTGEIPTEGRGEFLGDCYTRGTDMLSLDSLTKAPKPGIKAARITNVQPHSSEPKWQVLTVIEASAEGDKERTVVTGARGFAVDDVVAYAAVGVKFGKQPLKAVDKKGVQSEGVVLSEKELGVSDDNDKVAVLPVGTALGAEVAEVYRVPEAPAGVPVMEAFSRRKAECAAIQHAVETGKGEIWEQWKRSKEWSLDEFKRIYAWIDARFDHYFTESEQTEVCQGLVDEFLEKGVFMHSDGTIGCDLSKDKLGFCMLRKTDGTALYATRDLSLAQQKFKEYKVDRSLYVVDESQTFHFQQVFKCLEKMGYEQSKKCRHIAYAQVVLPDGKMSSRKGNVILFSQLEKLLLESIRKEHLAKFESPNPEKWSETEIADAAHKVAVAAMRYGMLNQDTNAQIVFDLEKWVSAAGNTGPYLMYAYARTRSILRAVASEHGTITIDNPEKDWAVLSHEFEQDLIAMLVDYPATIEKAADGMAPQIICAYAFYLAKKFSQWFSTKECSVLHADTAAERVTRALLVDAVGRVIQHALSLIGIKTLERM